jgi:hypothetical protein
MRRLLLTLTIALVLLGGAFYTAPTHPTFAAQRDESRATVYVTRTGERYHRGSCHHLRRSKFAVSISEAKRQGYTPCKVCRPAR